MLTQFRNRYPQGGLISELVQIDHTQKYIVKASVQVDGITLATGLAAADTVEQAEDSARTRALALLNIEETVSNQTITPVAKSTIADFDQMAKEIGNQQPSSPESLFLDSLTAPAPTAPDNKPLPNPEATPSPFLPEIEPQANSVELDTETELQPTAVNPVEPEQPFSTELADHEEIILTETEIQTSLFEQSETVKLQTPGLSQETTKSLTPTEAEFEHQIPPILEEETSVTQANFVDFSEVIAKTDLALKRLGWTNEQGRDYLLQTYGKRSRQLLSDAELLEFLHYLESQPMVTEVTPIDVAEVTTPTVQESSESQAKIPTNTVIDFSEVIARTNLELKRLGWTNEQGRDYLLQTYGKRSRQLLSDEELLEFLSYLETQP